MCIYVVMHCDSQLQNRLNVQISSVVYVINAVNELTNKIIELI